MHRLQGGRDGGGLRERLRVQRNSGGGDLPHADQARLRAHRQGVLDQRHHGRAAGVLHLLRAHLLPEAQAHGRGQDARARARPAHGPHAAAHGGARQGGRPAPRGDGARLPRGLRGLEPAAGAPDDLQRRLQPPDLPEVRPLLRPPRLVPLLQLRGARHARAHALRLQAPLPGDAVHERLLPLEPCRAVKFRCVWHHCLQR
mmetsp:Transcript_82902/g.243054  ORF Transcript_82902/g.243054 Transcript_82902/m.243054 type:complete len:201 (-) Transcript_82902:111-713(-)